MIRFMGVLAMVGVLAVAYGQVVAQVYEFSKPNVPVNDDSLGRHHHFNLSEGQHSVAARGDTFYAVWWDYRKVNQRDPDIYFTRSTDCGRTFAPNMKINDGADTMRQEDPSLCLEKGRGIIHIAWMDSSPGEWRIYYSRSTDGGRSFLPDRQLSDTFSMLPMVACNDRGTVCVAWWVGYYVWLIKSSNRGLTFGRPAIVNDFEAYNTDDASLAVDSSGKAYLAWHRYGTNHVYLSRSTDSGDTLFYPSVRVSDSMYRLWSAGYPTLVIGKQGWIYVALLDKRREDQAHHVYVARSTDGGMSFLPNVDVSDNNGSSFQRWPSIALDDSSNVYVTCTDYRNGDRCIYFARSTDSTATRFSSNILVNDTIGLSGTDRYGASVAANERGEAFVTWSDNRVSGSIQLYDIFSSRGIRKPSGIGNETSDLGFISGRIKCYPNPFSNSTLISYTGPKADKVDLKVYNLLGEEVSDLSTSRGGLGRYEVVWKGEDNHGLKVKSGVYFIKVSEKSTEGRLSSKFHLQKCIFLR